jgi:hypothetical protein
VAAYSWLAQIYDSVTAGLILAGFFAAVAILSATACALVRQRTAARARAELAAETSALLLDPRLLAVGVQAIRTLGWKTIAPLVVLGVLAAGIGRERGRRPDPAE